MRKILLFILMGLVMLGVSNAQELMVSDGGLLGIEGSYTTNLTQTYYGSTLYIMVANATTQDYAILVDGKNIGTNKATYTVTQESGTITVSTNPETTNMTITVLKQDGFSYWLAKYVVFAKGMPSITGSILWDTVIYTILVIPIITVILIKIVVLLIRAVT